MIHIQNLTLQVPEKKLLENFSATIQAGECIGIFGPNGAGKSTFLKALLSVFPKATGTIQLNGNKIAYLPQEFEALPADYSVIGFLQLLVRGDKMGLPLFSSQDSEQCYQSLIQVNALHLAKKLFKNLSGGEKKRVMLAAILLEKPTVLLLDEPLANLDPRYQSELLHLIEHLQKAYRLANTPLTVLITAHDFNPLLHLLNRVMFIGEGQAVLDVPEKAIQSDVLSELYKTPLEVVAFKGRQWILSKADEKNMPQQVFLNPGEHCHGDFCLSEH